MKRYPFVLIGALAGAQLGATDCGRITRDDGFDLWCGEELCVWKLVRGDVARVPTWHPSDFGVELLGDDTSISQLTPVTSLDTRCIRFDLIADVEPTAEVTLDVDVEGDGTVERRERIPTAHWKPLSFLIPIQPPYDGVRFSLSKRGAGRAVIAQIAAHTEIDPDCDKLPVADPGPRPPGAACKSADDCETSLCTAAGVMPPAASFFGLVCAECVLGPDDGCPAGTVCGFVDPHSPILVGHSACVPIGGREIGEQCVGDAECGSSICDRGVCSACRAGYGCADGLCLEAWNPSKELGHGPGICAPGLGRRRAGEPCAADGDCASGSCDGDVRKQCDDGRPCAGASNCPFEDDLSLGLCEAVGIQGGSCR